MRRTIRNQSVLVVFASACALVGFSQAARGQFGGFGNVLGGAQNLAVNQALSHFGQSLGAQLPIVVNDGDAYPTIPALPGAPFRPGAPPANLLALLKASSDGTVPLRPGDYSLGVNVFCMRISAHSPSAYRYVVAPLKGSAADVIEALNARAPALGVSHFPLQVLSWNIQAGLPYASMQPAQRAIVDKVIPDFRGRLAGDALENIRSKFSAFSSIPGMPGFDGAMGRLGAPGQAVLTMESVRQQLLTPPQSPEELARALVPFAPPAGTAAPRSTTPWSEYSSRVYVRFLTAGNYATPGTYEIRVLPATVSVASAGGLAALRAARRIAQSTTANVPMANIVNNPGSASVQPLTQGPSGGPGNESPPSAPPTPTPTPSAVITSETVATSPGNRDRTLIGVGEQVNLTFSGASASWSISGGGGKLSGSSGKTNILIAGELAGSCTITAVDTATHASATIAFTIIAPSGIHNVRTPSDSMIHDQGWPNSGFNMTVYLLPDTVSFENLEYEEGDASATATGYFSPENRANHDPKHGFVPVEADVPGKGSPVSETDQAYSGKFDLPRPFVSGSVTWNIPVYYEVVGHTSKNRITTVTQTSSLAADGVHLQTLKGDEHADALITDPTIDK